MATAERQDAQLRIAQKLAKEACFIVPHGFRVVVEEDQFKYTGLIEIPDTAKRRPTTGVVVAVPPEHVEAIGHLDGQRVVYAQFSGTLIQFKGRPAYRILAVEEILGFIVKTEEELVLEETTA